MIKSGKFFITLILAGCIILSSARASFSADRCSADYDEWCPPSAGPVVTWTAPLCSAGKLVVQPFFFYNRTRGTFDDEGHYKSFKDKEARSQAQQFLFFQYGITDRFEIDGQGVLQENMSHRDGKSAETTGFGDSYLFARYCAIDETRWVPQTTAFFQFKFPTGKYQKADEGRLGTDLMGATSGGGSYDHGYGVIFTKRLKPFILHADFIYTFPLHTRVDGVKTNYADYITYDLAAEYFFFKGFNLVFEMNWFAQGDRKYDGLRASATDISTFTLSPGIGWSCGWIQTLLAYERTIGGTNADVNDSIVFTFVYTF